MAYDGLITSFLGQGVAASRPAVPNISPDAIALYRATDTGALTVYGNSAWNALVSASPFSVTFNTSGGAAAGATFDGSAAKTIDYSTVGAAKTGAVTGSGLTQATGKLLGRTTASSGAIEEITVGSGLTLSAGSLSASGGGTVTTTGSPASGNLAKFSGATSIVNGDLSGDVTTSGTLAVTIANSAVTLAKIANASTNSKLLGSGSSGSGAAYSEITLGSGLSMSGTTISAGDLGVFHTREEQAVGTAAGASTAGKWHPRILNTDITTTITSAARVTATVTMTIASPCVVTFTAHGLIAGQAVVFTTSGALPTGLSASTIYYLVATVATDTFSVAATPGGAAINTSGSQSGTHTAKTSGITLPAGTYDIEAQTPAYDDAAFAFGTRLFNVTDNATIVAGPSEWNNGTSSGHQKSHARGRFTLSGTKVVSIDTFHGNAQATNGLGVNAGITGSDTNNRFTDVFIRRVS